MLDLPKIEKKGRNTYGTNSVEVKLTLPSATVEFLEAWARKHNLTISRAVHDMVWNTYHIEKGDYRAYEERS